MRIVKEHDERQNEILDSAEALFISKGYDKTTIHDILTMVGIAKGTLYYYFKSKEEIMDAVIMRVIASDMKVAREIVEKKDVSAFDKLLQILLSQSANANEKKSEMIKQFGTAENIFMKQRALECSIQYICPILAEVIEAGNKSREFQALYPLESIQFLVAGIQTMLDERMAKPTQEEMEIRLQSFVNIIFRILGIDETNTPREKVENEIKQIFKT